jgi:hypothetical protein
MDPQPKNDDLQFERAEFDAPPARVCGMCGQTLRRSYFQAGGRVLCADCAERVRQYASGEGADAVSALRVVVFGVGAAAVGGGIYGAIMAYSHFQVGLISIAVGYMVGKAVRAGSGGRGGVTCQWIAAVLTYAAIAGAYAFDRYHSLSAPTPDDLTGLIFAAYRLPFEGGVSNALGLAIIGFGVWQAWQMNRGAKLEVTGPHPLTPPKGSSGG